jgi:hypothetical protein
MITRKDIEKKIDDFIHSHDIPDHFNVYLNPQDYKEFDENLVADPLQATGNNLSITIDFDLAPGEIKVRGGRGKQFKDILEKDERIVSMVEWYHHSVKALMIATDRNIYVSYNDKSGKDIVEVVLFELC